MYHICVREHVQIHKATATANEKKSGLYVIQSHPATEIDVVSACLTLEGGTGDVLYCDCYRKGNC
jgi:hypothetical protein